MEKEKTFLFCEPVSLVLGSRWKLQNENVTRLQTVQEERGAAGGGGPRTVRQVQSLMAFADPSHRFWNCAT